MRRTSVLLEFSDEVYDVVVEPMKKNKSFSKLVATLIEGYLSDGYVRAYAEDNLENMRKAAVDSFSKSIDSMSESLSNMGLFTDELDTTSQSGVSIFNKRAEKEREELDSEGIKKHNNDFVEKDKKFEEVNERIDSLQKEVNSSMQQMLNMMQIISNQVMSVGMNTVPMQMANPMNMSMSGNIPATRSYVENSVESVKNSSNSSELSKDNNKGYVENSVESVKNEEKTSENDEIVLPDIYAPTTEDEKQADDFLKSMLDGNSFTF